VAIDLAPQVGLESACKRKRKDLQNTAGNVSTWKAVVVHVNGSQMDHKIFADSTPTVPRAEYLNEMHKKRHL
jgi:hypothetical protein